MTVAVAGAGVGAEGALGEVGDPDEEEPPQALTPTARQKIETSVCDLFMARRQFKAGAAAEHTRWHSVAREVLRAADFSPIDPRLFQVRYRQ